MSKILTRFTNKPEEKSATRLAKLECKKKSDIKFGDMIDKNDRKHFDLERTHHKLHSTNVWYNFLFDNIENLINEYNEKLSTIYDDLNREDVFNTPNMTEMKDKLAVFALYNFTDTYFAQIYKKIVVEQTKLSTDYTLNDKKLPDTYKNNKNLPDTNAGEGIIKRRNEIINFTYMYRMLLTILNNNIDIIINNFIVDIKIYLCVQYYADPENKFFNCITEENTDNENIKKKINEYNTHINEYIKITDINKINAREQINKKKYNSFIFKIINMIIKRNTSINVITYIQFMRLYKDVFDHLIKEHIIVPVDGIYDLKISVLKINIDEFVNKMNIHVTIESQYKLYYNNLKNIVLKIISFEESFNTYINNYRLYHRIIFIKNILTDFISDCTNVLSILDNFKEFWGKYMLHFVSKNPLLQYKRELIAEKKKKDQPTQSVPTLKLDEKTVNRLIPIKYLYMHKILYRNIFVYTQIKSVVRSLTANCSKYDEYQTKEKEKEEKQKMEQKKITEIQLTEIEKQEEEKKEEKKKEEEKKEKNKVCKLYKNNIINILNTRIETLKNNISSFKTKYSILMLIPATIIISGEEKLQNIKYSDLHKYPDLLNSLFFKSDEFVMNLSLKIDSYKQYNTVPEYFDANVPKEQDAIELRNLKDEKQKNIMSLFAIILADNTPKYEQFREDIKIISSYFKLKDILNVSWKANKSAKVGNNLDTHVQLVDEFKKKYISVYNMFDTLHTDTKKSKLFTDNINDILNNYIKKKIFDNLSSIYENIDDKLSNYNLINNKEEIANAKKDLELMKDMFRYIKTRTDLDINRDIIESLELLHTEINNIHNYIHDTYLNDYKDDNITEYKDNFLFKERPSIRSRNKGPTPLPLPLQSHKQNGSTPDGNSQKRSRSTSVGNSSTRNKSSTIV